MKSYGKCITIRIGMLGWFHWSDLEEKTLEDDIVAMSESHAEMGRPRQSRQWRQAIEMAGPLSVQSTLEKFASST